MNKKILVICLIAIIILLIMSYLDFITSNFIMWLLWIIIFGPILFLGIGLILRRGKKNEN